MFTICTNYHVLVVQAGELGKNETVSCLDGDKALGVSGDSFLSYVGLGSSFLCQFDCPRSRVAVCLVGGRTGGADLDQIGAMGDDATRFVFTPILPVFRKATR